MRFLISAFLEGSPIENSRTPVNLPPPTITPRPVQPERPAEVQIPPVQRRIPPDDDDELELDLDNLQIDENIDTSVRMVVRKKFWFFWCSGNILKWDFFLCCRTLI